MKILLAVFAATVLAFADDATEVTNCRNGSFGELSISETPSLSLTISGRFQRVSQCDSKSSQTRVAPGTCNVSLSGGTSAVEAVNTPSTTTPILSYLDAGPQLTITGPNGELRISRSINGGLTSYFFNVPRQAQPFLSAGRFEVKSTRGRDLPELELSLEYSPIVIASPSSGSAVSSANPPTIAWTGGTEALSKDMDIFILAATRDLRRTYEVFCRASQGTRGEFTVPREAWEQVPAEVRSSGLASFILSPRGPVATLPVPGLDAGIDIYFSQFPGATVQLVP
jgi:hypothetical protein